MPRAQRVDATAYGLAGGSFDQGERAGATTR